MKLLDSYRETILTSCPFWPISCAMGIKTFLWEIEPMGMTMRMLEPSTLLVMRMGRSNITPMQNILFTLMLLHELLYLWDVISWCCFSWCYFTSYFTWRVAFEITLRVVMMMNDNESLIYSAAYRLRKILNMSYQALINNLCEFFLYHYITNNCLWH